MAPILLVDDHPLFQEGLASVLARLAPQLGIVAADDAQQGLQVLRTHGDIALVLIDVMLPGTDGFAALSAYGAEFPHVPRVMISGRDDPALQRRARDAGASGFIAKALPAERLLAALRHVLDGGAYFDFAAPGSDAAAPQANGLTQRQLEVLRLVGEGRNNKEIARELDITERTVRAHLTELFRALGVSSRTQSVLAAQRLGLLPAP